MPSVRALRERSRKESEVLTYVMHAIEGWRKLAYNINLLGHPKTLVRLGSWLMERPLA